MDDMQWTEPATVTMLSWLAVDPELKYCMIIGVYRDNEVHENHPLHKPLTGFAKAVGPFSVFFLCLASSEKDVA